MPAVTTPDTLPDDVAALRAPVLMAWAEARHRAGQEWAAD